MSRPTRSDMSDPAVVERLCNRLIAGEGVSEICADPTMPSKSAFYERMAKDDEFRTRIARAREAQQEALIDETVEMADAATPDDWQVVRLRIWARQWRASKLAPKAYGDAVQLRHADAQGGRIEVSQSEAVARVAAIIEAARRRKEAEETTLPLALPSAM